MRPQAAKGMRPKAVLTLSGSSTLMPLLQNLPLLLREKLPDGHLASKAHDLVLY
jgi:hypothetical protein